MTSDSSLPAAQAAPLKVDTETDSATASVTREELKDMVITPKTRTQTACGVDRRQWLEFRFAGAGRARGVRAADDSR